MPKKEVKGAGISHLIRSAGHKAQAAATSQEGNGNLIVTSQDGRKTKIFDILTYIESAWGLQMKPYPVQRVIIKLYYHLPLDDKEKSIEVMDMFQTKVLYRLTEKEYVQYLYDEGRCNIREQDHIRRQLILPIGRRAGKTTLSAIFASYELYRLLSIHNPQAYYGLPNGNRIQIISVATDKEQASLLFNDVTAHIAKCEFFKPYIANNTLSYVQFRTPADIEKYGATVRHENGKFTSFNGKASLRITFKASVSKGLRGSGNIVIILDEMAHFVDKGNSSAKEIYDAITPSALAFAPKNPETQRPIGPVESRIIGISSPLNKAGKFYELYHFAMSRGEGSEGMLAIQAPTWEVNPTVEPGFLRGKYFEDPNVFMTEFGAQFSDRVRGWIERENILLDCIKPTLRPKTFGPPRAPHQAGVDVGLTDDGTSVAITHVEGSNIVLDYHESWYAGKTWKESNPHLDAPLVDYCRNLELVEQLDFEEIANWLHVLSKRFYITSGMFDHWNGITLEQSLHRRGLKQFRSEHFTRDLKSRIFQAAKMLMVDHRISLYDWPLPTGSEAKSKHSPLIEELFSLQAQQMSKNQVLVDKPKIAGAKDDASDALVRAIWLSWEKLSNQKVVASPRPFDRPNTGGLASTSLLAYQRQRMMARGGLVTDRLVPRGMRRR